MRRKKKRWLETNQFEIYANDRCDEFYLNM